jgi:uncharacterized protein (UPF0276 family)
MIERDDHIPPLALLIAELDTRAFVGATHAGRRKQAA